MINERTKINATKIKTKQQKTEKSLRKTFCFNLRFKKLLIDIIVILTILLIDNYYSIIFIA